MKKITIGIFEDSFYPMADGVIFVIDNYARRLLKYANVIVFVPKYLSKPYDDSIFPYKVVRCSSVKVPLTDYSAAMPKLDAKFKKELDSYNLDIVHVHSPFMMGKIGLEYAKKNHIPCVATMHSQFKQDFQKYVKNDKIADVFNKPVVNFFDKCDECWAVNKEVARIYYEDYGVKNYPKVMNNATEMLPVKDKEKGNSYINLKHNINKDDFVFLFVGRINTLKNILFIADALKLVNDKMPKLKWKMIYVGSGGDLEKLKNHVDSLGISDKVIYAGKITDRTEMAYYYVRANLFLFPSVYDASSIVQIEASSQNTPAVFLKNTATACTVEDNISGFLSDYSPEAYSDKIIEIINNKKLYEDVCENSFKLLYHNWDDVVENVFNEYLRIIKEYQNK